jgi:peptidoglycan L-alanyl-D-glutamate endopeptidase CwlK
MTYYFGATSRALRDTCTENLQRVANKAIEITPYDFCIICGHRRKDDQNDAFAAGRSTKRWPNSRHNKEPSEAFDFAPWIVDPDTGKGYIPWDDEGAFYKVGAVIETAAKMLGVTIRHGGDWDRDGLTEDQTFMDLGHIEEA